MQPELVTHKLCQQFPLDSDLIYLNHAALGPWPQCAVSAIQVFAEENLHRGALNYAQWMAVEASLRQNLARLIGTAEDSDIAIVKNTSEALSIVAQGLDWQAGQNVVLAEHEFPSNRQPWLALQQRGVTARQVRCEDHPQPHLRLIEHCDEHTRLIVSSTVHYASGVRVDWAALSDFCRSHDILLGLDAIQSLGALPLNIDATPVDFVASGSHKWLLAPEGLGFLYTSQSLRQRIALQQFGWRMCDWPFAFKQGDIEAAASARRFEPGTLNTLGMVALNASLELLFEIGLDQVAARILDNTAYLLEALAEISGLSLATPSERDQHAGIVSFSAVDPALLKRLYRGLQQEKIITAMRDGKLRLSPHCHTPREQLARCVERIKHHAAA